MALDIKAPDNVILRPIITVFGVGGAGGNAVNNMIRSDLSGANFVVANTDAQALEHSETTNRLQLGSNSTRGLGAGASPEVGRQAALESEDEIRAQLEGSNMVFITAGMGGGTGTGASPEIAKIAKELKILTVGVVTKPFLFEGAKRMSVAEKGIAELQKYVDTLIIIPNQNLFRIANENTTFQQAFEMADNVLHAGVRGVTDLITSPGLVNLDFADIETIMNEKGKAMMGTGEASGEDRAIKAAEAAIANPLLDQSSMCGACGVLINITGGKDMTLYEVDAAANRIREEVGETDTNIIFGSTFNPDLEGLIRVSVVATGIEQDKIREIEKQKDEINANNKNSSSVIAPHKKQKLQQNHDLSSEQPPFFDEYQELQSEEEYSQAEYSQNAEEVKELPENQQTNRSNSGSISDLNLQDTAEKLPSHRERNKVKSKSFLRRMWDSLKTGDEVEEYENHQTNNSKDKNKSPDSSNVKNMPSWHKEDV